ncbi:hypothetical protein G6F68_015991 [Rhizopus microsporus]|nr:hypothetical protein G6F68_015991 [Rhizopus microsporus]
MAPPPCHADSRGGDRLQRHAAFLERQAGPHLDRRPLHRGAPDVGRRVRPDLCGKRTLGRPAAHADPVHVRHRLRVPHRRAAGPGPAFEDAGHQGVVRRVHRIDPRRAADQPAVHVVGDAALVPAGRLFHRQAVARADRHHHVRRGLHRGNAGSRTRRWR